MVRKDRNHPSVIMYSIGNEIPDIGTPAGAALGSGHHASGSAPLDDTRLVTNSINPLLACGPELFASLARAERRRGRRPSRRRWASTR